MLVSGDIIARKETGGHDRSRQRLKSKSFKMIISSLFSQNAKAKFYSHGGLNFILLTIPLVL